MLKEKNVLITGASRGIGRAIALAMAEQGAGVAVGYSTRQAAAEAVCEELKAKGVKAIAVCCDVSDENSANEAVQQVIKQFGHLDILVNNAGINRDGMLLTMKEEDFDQVLNTNLKGAFHMVKFAGAHFLRRKQGTIINITSVVGLMGNAGQANYAAAKAGLIGFTKTVAKELAPRGITCNAIAPGFIATDMTEAMPEKAKEQVLGAIALKRMGQPEDVAHLAVFLASPKARYITGEVIKVDGGLYV